VIFHRGAKHQRPKFQSGAGLLGGKPLRLLAI
jgi:hypothetical protein